MNKRYVLYRNNEKIASDLTFEALEVLLCGLLDKCNGPEIVNFGIGVGSEIQHVQLNE